MNFNRFLPLTETTFYIMLSLLEPLHGYAVMQKVEELSDLKVRIAAGTLYGALQSLTKKKFVDELPSTDPRRRIYVLSPEGRELLRLEVERLKHMVELAKRLAAQKGETL
ncbi:MAG: PadR family transcriptional regulator [Coriobacteriales bacterium]|jgi:DNA-binding PadR family transcriptional regulator|nr:PadR family transcriptional regulator [Coriobacteriales bacterium]